MIWDRVRAEKTMERDFCPFTTLDRTVVLSSVTQEVPGNA